MQSSLPIQMLDSTSAPQAQQQQGVPQGMSLPMGTNGFIPSLGVLPNPGDGTQFHTDPSALGLNFAGHPLHQLTGILQRGLPHLYGGQPLAPQPQLQVAPLPGMGDDDRMGMGLKRPSGKDDGMDDDFGPYKKPKVAVDSVEPSDLAGNVFLKCEAAMPNCLLTFEGDISRPLFFKEEDSGAVEVAASTVGENIVAMDMKLPGVEVEADGTRRMATVGELISFLKFVYTNGEDSGRGQGGPPPIFMHVKCDESSAWLTFDKDSLKAKVITNKGGRVSEISPQQFELEAGCHARKWRNSFKVQAALKVIRQGILTPAPYVELHAYLHRLLNIDPATDKAIAAAKVKAEADAKAAAKAEAQAAKEAAAAAAAAAKEAAAAEKAKAASARAASPSPSRPPAGPGKTSEGGGNGGSGGAGGSGKQTGRGRGGGGGRESNDGSGLRKLGTSFVAIPIAPPGKVAGPLTPAEVQAIQAVVSLTDGPKLAWAVQGIMHHVFQQHSKAPPPS